MRVTSLTHQKGVQGAQVDNLAPTKNSLSVVDVQVKVLVEPLHTDVIMQPDVLSDEGSQHTPQRPVGLERRPIASSSEMNDASLQ